MLNALWMFVGGEPGSLARWWVSGFLADRFGLTFPSGMFVINKSS